MSHITTLFTLLQLLLLIALLSFKDEHRTAHLHVEESTPQSEELVPTRSFVLTRQPASTIYLHSQLLSPRTIYNFCNGRETPYCMSLMQLDL